VENSLTVVSTEEVYEAAHKKSLWKPSKGRGVLFANQHSQIAAQL
jgi:hypothetical protein